MSLDWIAAGSSVFCKRLRFDVPSILSLGVLRCVLFGEAALTSFGSSLASKARMLYAVES